MPDITYVTIPQMTAAQAAQIADTTLLEVASVDQNDPSGYVSRKATAKQIKDYASADVQNQIGNLANLDTTAKNNLVAAINEAAQSGGSGGSSTLSGLADVTLSNPSNGQILKYNGSKWVNGNESSGITVDSAMSSSSTNPVQNKVIKGEIDSLKDDLAQSASIDSSGLISFKNSDSQTVFTLQLPIYNGGVG